MADASEYDVPSECLYTREDEWVRMEDAVARIGITDYAQDQLGDVVFVELPEVGTRVAQGETFGSIESVKAVSDLFAPISGEVLEVNTALADSPEVVNESCYEDGWMLAIAPSDPEELEGLLSADAYVQFIKERQE